MDHNQPADNFHGKHLGDMQATAPPTVSVVIPTYNQGKFLDDAIQGVLAQTYQDYEIIVVNDGSTDDTEAVLRRYKDRIRYFFQENQGLAGARNTGILAARGDFVALLDSDDIWEPSFLASMMALAQTIPAATVYFCGIHYMDENKHDLPQYGGIEVTDTRDLYKTVLRSNFLIPSTIVMRREPILAANLFDISFRRLQDWDLWIRLLRSGHPFAGLTGRYLVHYRVHENNLSTDSAGGQQAAKKLIEKHFGPDDGEYATWDEEKRWAYGGLYRYFLLNTIQRQNNWQQGVDFLRWALLSDPSLMEDLDFFYELALGSQHIGYRGTANHLDLEDNGKKAQKLLIELLASTQDFSIQSRKNVILGSAYKAIGLAAYNTGQYALCRKYLWRAVLKQPGLLHEQWVSENFIKSFLGNRGLIFLRDFRKKMNKS